MSSPWPYKPYLCTHTHTHPRTSGFCSLRADQVLREKKSLVNTNPTPYGNISNPKGPPPSIKPVQSSIACKVWLNPGIRLNHSLQVLLKKMTLTTALQPNLPNYSIFKELIECYRMVPLNSNSKWTRWTKSLLPNCTLRQVKIFWLPN